MTHSQVFGQKFTPIRRFSAWKSHPFWPHTHMTQYGSAPPPPPGPDFVHVIVQKLEIKAVTSCSTHKIDQQETDG